MKTRYLVPKLQITGWSSDGMHTRDWRDRHAGLSFADGWSVVFAWLGLHVEFVIAIEREFKI